MDIMVGLDVSPTIAELNQTRILVALGTDKEHCLLLRSRSDKGLNVYERVGTIIFSGKARVFHEQESAADLRKRLGWRIEEAEIILI